MAPLHLFEVSFDDVINKYRNFILKFYFKFLMQATVRFDSNLY